MSHVDIHGERTSLSDAAVAQAWDRVLAGFLAHARSVPDDLACVIEADPSFAQAHAARGLFSLSLARSEMVPVAREALKLARQGRSNEREAAYVDALALWLEGNPAGAANRLDLLLRAFPGDAFAMKLVQAIRFMLGDAKGMLRSLQQIAPAYAGDHVARGYHDGCRAFALEEIGDYGSALTHGTRAVEREPRDAWGLHAVAHVHDMMAAPRDGLHWLDTHSHVLDHCNNFAGHVWWHRALMHLELGEHDAALALYDAEVRALKTDDFRDVANASSLLARLSLEDVDVADRWDELADIGEARAEDDTYTFADLHTMLSLSGGSRPAARARMIAAMHGADRATHHGRIASDPGVALAQGIDAFAEGEYRRAHKLLFGTADALPTIGGSHAQRDVFFRILIEAALRAGSFGDARTLLVQRRLQRGGHVDAFDRARSALAASPATSSAQRSAA